MTAPDRTRTNTTEDLVAERYRATPDSPVAEGNATIDLQLDHEFHLAEAEHQQYLDANPNGYCPVHATGVCLSGDCNPSS